ncbi:Acyl-CoA hydrolase [Chitinophaga terrae (ex Kim and Jung 2007)]|uniref:Acyl-CoA hydrolase n=1 Tax=Chitinophaga terrae (ex Kim and Jung 2007) TaxID=408074 RepID=A0A1H4B6J1_9BACT|nr:acyl-CoA thioesterase [Chitinophaga terrae (ex Kim and Jung 2007)]MDQ0106348.1 acyl-CoA hydrolase [Chitinophaga terrae (ex Kim and Jung 2007)]GEP91186.1 acyl-CoA thioesterase [Chitinophaga terrae (ex Kim and Jung 2007)]SEA43737.1 Acyl-CoA hydrolase [Chitinophaga terrae (ex Kim and Jung 2007)]
MDSIYHTITLRFLAEPSDVNFGGKVHGGSVMKWIDQAGYTCAANWSGQYAVTVYVGGIRFFKPISIGDLVEINAKIIYTGKTSMHISIDVFAGNPRQQQKSKTTHCVMVFAAVDDTGKPIPVPKWQPQTANEINLEQYAKKLMDLRKDIDEEMKPYL